MGILGFLGFLLLPLRRAPAIYQLMDKRLVDYSLSSEEECNGEKEQN